MTKKRIYRSKKNRIIGGVAGGLAEYLDTDPTIVRLIWVLGTLLWGAGLIAYLVAWIIIPEEPEKKTSKKTSSKKKSKK